jgi:hypothetical protein
MRYINGLVEVTREQQRLPPIELWREIIIDYLTRNRSYVRKLKIREYNASWNDAVVHFTRNEYQSLKNTELLDLIRGVHNYLKTQDALDAELESMGIEEDEPVEVEQDLDHQIGELENEFYDEYDSDEDEEERANVRSLIEQQRAHAATAQLFTPSVLRRMMEEEEEAEAEAREEEAVRRAMERSSLRHSLNRVYNKIGKWF